MNDVIISMGFLSFLLILLEISQNCFFLINSMYGTYFSKYFFLWDCHVRYRIVVGFTTTCAISAFHH